MRRSPERIFSVLLAVCLFLVPGCVSMSRTLPLTPTLSEAPASRMLAGKGEAYRFRQGTWVRLPEYDYEFTVLQRMLPDGWESVKEIHRRHPDYNGGGGPRDQTLYFRVTRGQEHGEIVELSVASALGRGRGTADSMLAHITITFSPEITMFAPFNAYRLTQDIGKGEVSETIELFKEKDGVEIPFMKMKEHALVFEPVK